MPAAVGRQVSGRRIEDCMQSAYRREMSKLWGTSELEEQVYFEELVLPPKSVVLSRRCSCQRRP